jgi:hypothetical protein
MLPALACLLLLCISAELYLVIRGIGGMRELSLQTEEHHLLVELGSDSVGEQFAPLWHEYEQARWLQRLHHWQELSPGMQFLLHGSFGSGARRERHASTRYAGLLRTQMQSELARVVPVELAAISESRDEQLAVRKLARLLTLACYARFCRNCEEGKQLLRNSADGKTREQLDRLFAMLDNGESGSRRQS